ncbi:hypothetical protein DBV15_00911 [Temnothorax longispinosus]|uniref:Uncharacterized protein n=1 Tax=Temnothorax longispinosus TaxID=300112 RepID=A0A4S2JE76_9HYME|nr:hypothetical protein DBV15_00911 [Temnothorax longispinosus]
MTVTEEEEEEETNRGWLTAASGGSKQLPIRRVERTGSSGNLTSDRRDSLFVVCLHSNLTQLRQRSRAIERGLETFRPQPGPAKRASEMR